MSVQKAIIEKYGQPGAAYERKFCMMWDVKIDFPELAAVFPHAIEINKDFQVHLKKGFTDLRAVGLLRYITKYGGCLQNRTTRGSTLQSLHSWALAFDLDDDKAPMIFHHVLNPFDAAHNPFPKQFVDIMEAAGLFWGGYYSTRYDPMHFSLFNG